MVILYIPSCSLAGQVMDKRMLDWSVALQHLSEVNIVVAKQLMKSDHQRRLPLVLAHGTLSAVDDEQTVGVDQHIGGALQPLQPTHNGKQLTVVDIVRRAGPAQPACFLPGYDEPSV
jgi:hypothetical protein